VNVVDVVTITRNDISPEAWERLLIQQRWLEARPEFLAVKDQQKLQLMLAEGTPSNDTIGVIRQFSLLVDNGITPPAHILVAVAKGFREYLKSESLASLDVAFHLKPKQRVGHPLKHRKERETRARILYQIWCLRREAKSNGEKLSIENAAGKIINLLERTDLTEDGLKKDYIAMDIDSIFDEAMDVLDEIPAEKK
jgi:hypothetical protein